MKKDNVIDFPMRSALAEGAGDSFFQKIVYGKWESSERGGSVCPVCGMTSEAFNRTGSVQCGACYKAFEKEIGRVIERLQGSRIYEGKRPRREGGAIHRV